LPSAIASKIFRQTDPTHLVQPADLVVANSGSNTVSVLLGSENFDGTFTEAAGSPFAVGINPSGVVIADFNGDGFLDFAVVNQGDNTISVFQGDGLGGFTPFQNHRSRYRLRKRGRLQCCPAGWTPGQARNCGAEHHHAEYRIFQASGVNTGADAFDGTFVELMDAGGDRHRSRSFCCGRFERGRHR
jgi:hypothetical protein